MATMAMPLPMSAQLISFSMSPAKYRATATMSTSFTHSDGWKWDATGQLDPPPRAEDLGADRQYRNQRDQAEAVDPADRVQERMVVDQREDKHRDQPTDQPKDLLLVEADKLGVHRGRVDLEDRDDRQDQYEAEQRPIEVAEANESAHAPPGEPSRQVAAPRQCRKRPARKQSSSASEQRAQSAGRNACRASR